MHKDRLCAASGAVNVHITCYCSDPAMYGLCPTCSPSDPSTSSAGNPQKNVILACSYLCSPSSSKHLLRAFAIGDGYGESARPWSVASMTRIDERMMGGVVE